MSNKVSFAEAIENIQKEQHVLIFTRASTISSWVTRVFTGKFFKKEAQWSHTGVYIQGKVYHSTLGVGCHVSSLKEFIRDTTFCYYSFLPTYELEGSRICHEEVRAIECLDREYDVGIAVEMASSTRDTKDATDQVEAEKKMVCSEYSEYICFGTDHSLTPDELWATVEGQANA